MSEILQALREATSSVSPKIVISTGGRKWGTIIIDGVNVGYVSCDPADTAKWHGRAASARDALTKYWIGAFTYRGTDYRIGPTARMGQLEGKIAALLSGTV